MLVFKKYEIVFIYPSTLWLACCPGGRGIECRPHFDRSEILEAHVLIFRCTLKNPRCPKFLEPFTKAPLEHIVTLTLKTATIIIYRLYMFPRSASPSRRELLLCKLHSGYLKSFFFKISFVLERLIIENAIYIIFQEQGIY